MNVALQNAFKKAAAEERKRDLAKTQLVPVLQKSEPLKNKLAGLREELIQLKSKLPTGGSTANPALRRKLEAQIREKERESADLEKEIAGLSADYRRKLEIYFKTVRDWQDAVKKWLKSAADGRSGPQRNTDTFKTATGLGFFDLPDQVRIDKRFCWLA